MNFLEKRRNRKASAELLRHSRHFLHMREDIMSTQQVDELKDLRSRLRGAVQSKDYEAQDQAHEALYKWLVASAPPKSMSSLRENLEILAVAVAVAMACRTYFIQPFKIPTGSMQPTLYGIQHIPIEKPGLMDRFPLKLFKWAATGQWYREIKTASSGTFTKNGPGTGQSNDDWLIRIENKIYKIPKQGALLPRQGAYVSKGTVLWRGLRVAGDHVFVDKFRWNFRSPKRGQITVFDTDDIDTLQANTHYIKRLVGLPGERISIDPPKLLINGNPVDTHETMRKIMNQTDGYGGYKLATGDITRERQLRRRTDFFNLVSKEYFTLGDNTSNSKDGRYWGAVPQGNMVGPAVLVYWPFSARWGSTK